MNDLEHNAASSLSTILPDGGGGYTLCPELMTEAELIQFLRIPLVSKAEDLHHVVEHLKRMRGLPCIHISKQPLYPLAAVREWIQQEVVREQGR
jgi:hypothetical protein